MVIIIPYRPQGHISQFHSRPHSSTNGPNPTTASAMSPTRCWFISSILCRVVFSLFLFTMALFLVRSPSEHGSNQHGRSNAIPTILFTVAIILFIRTCRKIRQYYALTASRRGLIQRLRQRQQVCDLTGTVNIDPNSENVIIDLPSYKELFPSRTNLNDESSDSVSLSPPTYDDFVRTFLMHHPITSLPILSSRYIWITDQTQRLSCIPGTVTYV